MSAYLGVGMEGPLTAPVERAGGVNCDGSSRRIITTYLENIRAAVLKTGLGRHHDQTARPWAHPQLDTLTESCVTDNNLEV